MPQRIFICRDRVFEISHLLRHPSWHKANVSKLATKKGLEHLPIRSHVCSLAMASLWIIDEGAATPFGTTVGTDAGETWVEPLGRGAGVEGSGDTPLR
jgi:hypothetical protein